MTLRYVLARRGICLQTRSLLYYYIAWGRCVPQRARLDDLPFLAFLVGWCITPSRVAATGLASDLADAAGERFSGSYDGMRPAHSVRVAALQL